jgi:hypothetical protein
MSRTLNRLLLVTFLAGVLSLAGFRFMEVKLPLAVIERTPDYIVALDSLTTHYLQKDLPTHNRSRNLHKILVGRLKKAGIDTVLYYQSGCVGCEMLPDRNALDKPNKNCQCSEEELAVYLFCEIRERLFLKSLTAARIAP